MRCSPAHQHVLPDSLAGGRHHRERIVRRRAPPDLQSPHQLGVRPDLHPLEPAHHEGLPHPLLTPVAGEAVTTEASPALLQTLSAVLAAAHISLAAELVEILVPDSLSIPPPTS